MTRRRLAGLLLAVSAAVSCGAPTSVVPGDPAPVDDGSPSVQAPHTSPTPSPSRTAVVVGSARTLVLPPLVRDQIIAAWVAGVGLAPEDVAGVSPGTAYYGYMPSTSTYWALATFDPTEAWERKATASPGSGVAQQFQDGPWIFSHQRDKGWRYLGATHGALCAPKVPAAMLAAWGLPTNAC